MHPLFVHFPIALLTIYSLMEFAPARLARRFAWWQGAKVFILAMGVFSAFPTLMTGDIDSHSALRRPQHALIEVHEGFAGATVNVYMLLLGAYAVRLLEGSGRLGRILAYLGPIARLWRVVHKISKWILDTPLRLVIVLLGITVLTITGGLGASIVYGPDTDPIVRFIYNLVM